MVEEPKPDEGKPENGDRVTAWIDSEVAAAIRAEARRLDRSVSWVVRKILEAHMARSGGTKE